MPDVLNARMDKLCGNSGSKTRDWETFASPEKFTNYEVGVTWDVRRYLSLTSALYGLNCTNTRSRFRLCHLIVLLVP